MPHFEITDKAYTISEIILAVESNQSIVLSTTSKDKICKNRLYLENKIADENNVFYGINTGFGSLCNVKISHDELSTLQENLVKSHACGMGYTLPQNICQLIFFIKIINLSKAYSGVRLSLVEHMIDVYNKGIYPVIFEQGSLGASGDLAPLAHLSLMLIGEGKVYYKNEFYNTQEIFSNNEITPIKLAAKEGLALLNGTQFSLAHAMLCCHQAKKSIAASNTIASMSLEAFGCNKDPFDPLIGHIRNNKDQSAIAAEILNMCSDSIIMNKKFSVQDPYSFRCIPQVHGASLTAINHVYEVVENELNAVTDNPNIFDEEDKILSAGNFHAQSLALTLDYLCLAMAELANISERRIFQLIHGERELPAFLIKDAGLNSGFMIAQYTAASIVSQNKQLCTPSSIDSIPSSRGQEDHVSMAANGATKCIKVCDNVISVLAIEWIVAAQAVDFRNIEEFSSSSKKHHTLLRKEVPHLASDRILHDDFIKAKKLLATTF